MGYVHDGANSWVGAVGPPRKLSRMNMGVRVWVLLVRALLVPLHM